MLSDKLTIIANFQIETHTNEQSQVCSGVETQKNLNIEQELDDISEQNLSQQVSLVCDTRNNLNFEQKLNVDVSNENEKGNLSDKLTIIANFQIETDTNEQSQVWSDIDTQNNQIFVFIMIHYEYNYVLILFKYYV